MCCGFGAVILLFMIINSQIKNQVNLEQTYPENKANQLKFDLLETRKRLVLAKNSFKDLDQHTKNAHIEKKQLLTDLRTLLAILHGTKKKFLAHKSWRYL